MFKACVITASDKGSAGQRDDVSGRLVQQLLSSLAETISYTVVPDDREQLAAEMIRAADQLEVDLIVTTGGTGLSLRDVTPEATRMVIDREVPGLAEAMRAKSLVKTNRAMLSRGIAGTRGRTLIINLPGSPKAVEECLAVVLPVLDHALLLLRGETSECGRLKG